MMKEWKKTLAVMLAVSMIALAGCSSNEDPTTTAAVTETETAQTTEASVPATETAETQVPPESSSDELPTEPEPVTMEVFKMDRMEDSLDWLGKTADQAGIPDECILTGDMLWVVTVQGKLFGKDAEGTFELLDNEDGTKIDGIELTCASMSYEEGKQFLTERYGAPIEEKTDASGQTDQGIVTYAVFQNGDGEVWLSKGTEEDFTRVEVY